jgi:hypothetical protein
LTKPATRAGPLAPSARAAELPPEPPASSAAATGADSEQQSSRAAELPPKPPASSVAATGESSEQLSTESGTAATGVYRDLQRAEYPPPETTTYRERGQ